MPAAHTVHATAPSRGVVRNKPRAHWRRWDGGGAASAPTTPTTATRGATSEAGAHASACRCTSHLIPFKGSSRRMGGAEQSQKATAIVRPRPLVYCRPTKRDTLWAPCV
eukprot:178416-Pleurochrysis_carterae.AAC.1